MSYLIPETTAFEVRRFLSLIKGQRILFAGGTGLIGRWFLEIVGELSSDNFDTNIIVTGRSRPKWLAERYGGISVSFTQLDFNNNNRFLNTLGVDSFDQVWFFAAPSASDTFFGMGGYEKFKFAINAAQFIAQCVEVVRPSVLCLASSGVAVSSQVSKLISEQETGAPDLFGEFESLAHGKRVLERMCWELSKKFGLATSILRIFSCYGPHIPTDLHYAIGNFLGNVKDGSDIVIRSDGSALRSYSYASDLIVMICLELTRQIERQQGFEKFNLLNLGSDKAVTIRELAEAVLNAGNNSQSRINILGQSAQTPGNRVRNSYCPDTRLCKSLGIYRDQVSMSDGLQSLLEI